ncbi:MAG: rhomboid family intramembrane serine protease [Thermotogota bacterium]
MRKTITNYLIGINALIFIMMFIFGGFSAFNNPRILLIFGAQYGPLVAEGQWIRLITSMFVHGGFFHILLNMFALFYFGNVVEKVYGPYKYFSVFMISGIVGNILTHLIIPGSFSVGASGAIFGLVGLLFGAGFRDDTPRILQGMTGTALLPIILINVIFGFTAQSINNFAHLGGLAAGFTFGWLTPIRFSTSSWKLWKYIYYLLIGVGAASFIALVIFDIISF